jgi:hypothetical protein
MKTQNTPNLGYWIGLLLACAVLLSCGRSDPVITGQLHLDSSPAPLNAAGMASEAATLESLGRPLLLPEQEIATRSIPGTMLLNLQIHDHDSARGIETAIKIMEAYIAYSKPAREAHIIVLPHAQAR